MVIREQKASPLPPPPQDAPNPPEPSRAPVPSTEPKASDDPDLVQRMIEYIAAELPELNAEVRMRVEENLRREFSGERVTVRRTRPGEVEARAQKVRRLFNGRNATELARTLGVGRATVYRIVKTGRAPA